MCRLRDLLHEVVLTVSGRTLGENLDAWEAQRDAFYACDFLKNVHLTPKDVIVERKNSIREDGGIAILKGNIAPKGAVVRHSAVDASMQKISGRVRLFTSEDDAIAACIAGSIQNGHMPLPQRQDTQTGALAIYRSLAQQALDGAGMAL